MVVENGIASGCGVIRIFDTMNFPTAREAARVLPSAKGRSLWMIPANPTDQTFRPIRPPKTVSNFAWRERATQDRVIAFFSEEPDYGCLGTGPTGPTIEWALEAQHAKPTGATLVLRGRSHPTIRAAGLRLEEGGLEKARA